ncbi:hypothetical protein R3P38DRAFT_2808893 [Favolaschia claudopus]|uniref:Uncharacterized protein n=1 Tax=Favolaschia claudopus TaxID=2862362 RepID=A0AAV9ZEN4_9AGAR
MWALFIRLAGISAYWLLNPQGSERLDAKHADQMGFPSLKLSTTVFGLSWDDIVYAGLGDFHKAKGFDPYSQEVAVHLRKPLYQLVCHLPPVEKATILASARNPQQSKSIPSITIAIFAQFVSAPSSFVPYPLHYADLDGLWTTERARNDSTPSLSARSDEGIDSSSIVEKPMPAHPTSESSSITDDELLQPHSQGVAWASATPSKSFNNSVTNPQSLLEDAVTLRPVSMKRRTEGEDHGAVLGNGLCKRGRYSSRMSARRKGKARGG